MHSYKESLRSNRRITASKFNENKLIELKKFASSTNKKKQENNNDSKNSKMLCRA